MKKNARYLTVAWGLSPLLGLLLALSGCGGQAPTGWGRLERDFEEVRSEYQRRLDAADTTVEIIDAASFGWVRFEDLLARVADLRIASGESAAVVEKEIAALKSKVLADGEQESAKFDGGSFSAYVGGLVANDEVAMALAEMLAAAKGNVL